MRAIQVCLGDKLNSSLLTSSFSLSRVVLRQCAWQLWLFRAWIYTSALDLLEEKISFLSKKITIVRHIKWAATIFNDLYSSVLAQRLVTSHSLLILFEWFTCAFSVIDIKLVSRTNYKDICANYTFWTLQLIKSTPLHSLHSSFQNYGALISVLHINMLLSVLIEKNITISTTIETTEPFSPTLSGDLSYSTDLLHISVANGHQFQKIVFNIKRTLL